MYSHRLPAGHKASSLAALLILVSNVHINTIMTVHMFVYERR